MAAADRGAAGTGAGDLAAGRERARRRPGEERRDGDRARSGGVRRRGGRRRRHRGSRRGKAGESEEEDGGEELGGGGHELLLSIAPRPQAAERSAAEGLLRNEVPRAAAGATDGRHSAAA